MFKERLRITFPNQCYSNFIPCLLLEQTFSDACTLYPYPLFFLFFGVCVVVKIKQTFISCKYILLPFSVTFTRGTLFRVPLVGYSTPPPCMNPPKCETIYNIFLVRVVGGGGGEMFLWLKSKHQKKFFASSITVL